MKVDEIVERSRDLARPYRVTDGEKFRLEDVDAGDTAGLDEEDKSSERGTAGGMSAGGKMTVKRRSWVMTFLALLPSAVLADTVYLKGGGKVSGRIVTRTATELQVDVGAGTLNVSMANVDRIVEGASPLSEYARRAAALGQRDVDGWRELGRWARSQGLNTQARQAYEKVLALAPGDAEANQALGQVQVGGRWVSEEESYRARGYVKFEGEWMTPAEQQKISQDRAAAENRARRETPPRETPKPKADEETQEGIPLYWGWGTGPAAWPGTNFPAGVAPLPARNPK